MYYIVLYSTLLYCIVIYSTRKITLLFSQTLHYFNSSFAQGLMFGYATDETPEYMPLTLQLAHQMNRKIAELRRDGTLWWARPDSKTQVTAEYQFENGACVPIRVHTVVVSCQHSEKVTLEALRMDIMEKVIKTTIPNKVRLYIFEFLR